GIGLSRGWTRSGFSLRSCLARSLRPLPASLGRPANTFLRTPPADAPVLQALETLERMLRPLEKDQPPFLLLLEALSKRADLFHRLRAVLRLEEKNPTAKKLHQF